MSDTGNYPEWGLDPAGAGSIPEAALGRASEPGQAPVSPGADLQHPPPPGPDAQQRRRRRLIVLLFLLVLAGVVLFILMNAVVSSGAPSYKVSPARHPATVLPSAVYVGFGVKNTGSATGTPTCTVDVALPTGKVLGKGRFTLVPLDPGKGVLEVEKVDVTETVSHPLAVDQMDVQVTCT